MNVPRWDDPALNAGTMVRTALWLVTEVGIGNSFTKEQHRQAFAGVTQADRRLRDLRKFGWVIHTNLEDLTLKQSEQRLVHVGLHVWESGIGRTAPAKTMSSKHRREIFAEHNYQCAICGIAGGEKYPDSPQVTAVLSVVGVSVAQPNGYAVTDFSLQCSRCRVGGQLPVADSQRVLDSIRRLSTEDMKTFIRWTETGRQQSIDRTWAEFRRLPTSAQDEIRRVLLEESHISTS